MPDNKIFSEPRSLSLICVFSHGTMAESSDGKKLNGPQNRKYLLSGHAWRMFAGPGSRRPSSEVREPGSQRLPLSTLETTGRRGGRRRGWQERHPLGDPLPRGRHSRARPQGPGSCEVNRKWKARGFWPLFLR